MAIYKSYVEAVLENGSTKGVYTDGKDFYTKGSVDFFYDLSECSPADYLETLTCFHERGLRLTNGDQYTNLFGETMTVSKAIRDGC